MPVPDSFNQSPPFEDVDLYGSDKPLQEAVAANGGAEGEVRLLAAFGRRWGAAEMAEHARLANENPPRLQSFDAKGFRRDLVEYHPSYHHLLRESTGASLHCSTWMPSGTPAGAPAEVLRAARLYMVSQIENGHLCPCIMTRAAVAPLTAGAEVGPDMIRKVVSRHYDPDFRPWDQKFGITLGMALTERQAGTDVKLALTQAAPCEGGWALTGHKWFVSAPMSDAFIVLAQTAGGPACFAVPRFRPDGSVNALQYLRAKNKLGNRSNASVEVDLGGAFGWLVGEPGHGVRLAMEMVQLARADCAVTSAGLMRAALAQAIHHVRHRSVFGRHLAEQPLMRAVLADMALDVEAAAALSMRLARAFDLATEDPRERLRARLLTPVSKYHIAKAAPALIAEAMECLGGNGFIEDGPMPRLYREAPVNAIWEGSGNVTCLDVVRTFARERNAALGVVAALAADAGDLPGAVATVAAIKKAVDDSDSELKARRLVEALAVLASAAALREMSSPAAEIFARTRLAGPARLTYGTHDLTSAEIDRLIARALPG